MSNVPEIFGSMVFNDHIMSQRMPKEAYDAFKCTINEGRHLDIDVASAVANAMKDWAIEKGATHFTHWFQPMTGVTAEKHDSFIKPAGDDQIIMEFSGKSLVRGEPDASSFPSGGLRATFEARGYTAWDPTSYAFIKDNTLYIPTAFCSYSGDALDKKTPLLRSIEAIDRQAVRLLKIIGNTEVEHVITMVGAEQEYFLIDESVYKKRPDLLYCGRTLIGKKPPKAQDLDDHYFGAIKPRVASFMKELDEELWKLGVLAKTEHNEAAPAQHELAPVYCKTNTAVDHNQLTMELMKSIAIKHGLACLLHEKPFAEVNGSGKHNNWSIATDKGENLLKPGKTPYENAQFLLFLSAVIRAVDENQDLLRISVSGAGNDHRLGGNEAPPAIVSIFLGSELTRVVEAITNSTLYEDLGRTDLKTGVNVLPHLLRDTTDRNRTSPFAFTGNKFEFRMLGSAQSVADPNITLNTIIADVFEDFANKLENSKDIKADLNKLIKQTLTEHKKIIFDGNNYSQEWIDEAEKRGLLNLRTSVDAIERFNDSKNIRVFTHHNVFTEQEIFSRSEIMLESYCKTLHIEAQTLIMMMHGEVIPAVLTNQKELVSLAKGKKQLGIDENGIETQLIASISQLLNQLDVTLKTLEDDVLKAEELGLCKHCAEFYRDNICSGMLNVRKLADKLEGIVAKKYWPYPSYADMLNSVR